MYFYSWLAKICNQIYRISILNKNSEMKRSKFFKANAFYQYAVLEKGCEPLLKEPLQDYL